MRADARRNRERIIAAAKAEITENGSDVSMEQIAKLRVSPSGPCTATTQRRLISSPLF